MSLIDFAYLAVACALTGALAWAAINDARVRLIPNKAVLAAIGLFAIWAALNRGAGLASALEAGGIALVVTVTLYAFRIVGAGDAKLYSAVALFAGLEHLAVLTLVTALTGGLIAAVSLASRPTRAMVMFTLRGKGDYGRGIPYGVAIATGGTLTIWIEISLLMDLPWSALVRQGLAQTSF